MVRLATELPYHSEESSLRYLGIGTKLGGAGHGWILDFQFTDVTDPTTIDSM